MCSSDLVCVIGFSLFAFGCWTIPDVTNLQESREERVYSFFRDDARESERSEEEEEEPFTRDDGMKGLRVQHQKTNRKTNG